ncbi:MAG TPA: thrombospondin type 3 repeat-containing protein, partial [Byssovorax sp.]
MPRALAAWLASAVALLGVAAPRTASANGDGAMNVAAGNDFVLAQAGVVTASLGSAGRGLASGVASEPLVISTVPTGATVAKAYLYWQTVGAPGQTTIKLNGTMLTGTLVGTQSDNPGICGQAGFDAIRSYRVDVTPMVTGNATYTVTTLASNTSGHFDSEGVSLVVLYQGDPAAAGTAAHIVIQDGAVELAAASFTGTAFTSALQPKFVPSDTTGVTASLRLLVGEGDAAADGPLHFGGQSFAPAFSSAAGGRWDDVATDVTTGLTAGASSEAWSLDFSADCVTPEVAVLTITYPDADGDLVADPDDNCPAVSNASQLDTDHDGVGDLCDACRDTDGDGYPDPGAPAGETSGCAHPTTFDNCPAVANDQTDSDGDGKGDACDTCRDTDGDGYPDPGAPAGETSGCAHPTTFDNCQFVSNNQADTDGDGVGDACDTCRDTD